MVGMTMNIREFPSMDACEAVATHIHSLRMIPGNKKGLRGDWKTNDSRFDGNSEPTVFTVCVPDPAEITEVATPLREAGLYRLTN